MTQRRELHAWRQRPLGSAVPTLLVAVALAWARAGHGQTEPAPRLGNEAPGAAAVSSSLSDALPDNDVIMRALTAELDRAMSDLTLEGLDRPYFVQYTVEDRVEYNVSATYAAITDSQRSRGRVCYTQVRVGDSSLDNTNFLRGRGGNAARLPIEDDELAMRQGIWRATDGDYKQAVESLTRKQAYLKDKTIEDRPADFSPAEKVVHLDPSAELVFDQPAWEQRARALSARFAEHTRIQDAAVRVWSAAANSFVVNSEGTRLRDGDTGALVAIEAELQADEGMTLSDSLAYFAPRADLLPTQETMLADIDELCGRLSRLAESPVLESYTGPVLFAGKAAPQMFAALLARGLAGQPDPVGSPRRSSGIGASLEPKLGLRILPRSYQAHDDPSVAEFGEEYLAGHYEYDDEGVPGQRVSLVENGILKDLVMSRSPTKKRQVTNGHGRGRGASISAAVSNLFISDSEGMSDEELRQEFINACKEEGLEFGLKVTALKGSGRGGLPDPLYAYKVYVADGREEQVRGIEFGQVQVRILKRILASGTQQHVHNSIGGTSSSIISPSVLIEELEANKIIQEFDKPPVLASPLARE